MRRRILARSILVVAVALAATVGSAQAHAGATLGVNAGGFASFMAGSEEQLLGGLTLSLGLGWEWLDMHRASIRGEVSYFVPAGIALDESRVQSDGWIGTLLAVYRFRPGWDQVDPFIEAGLGVSRGHTPMTCEADVCGQGHMDFMPAAHLAGGARIALNEHVALVLAVEAAFWPMLRLMAGVEL